MNALLIHPEFSRLRLLAQAIRLAITGGHFCKICESHVV